MGMTYYVHAEVVCDECKDRESLHAVPVESGTTVDNAVLFQLQDERKYWKREEDKTGIHWLCPHCQGG